MITSVRSHSHVLEGNPRWRYEVVPQVQCCFQLLLEFTRSWLSLNNIAPDVIWMCSFFLFKVHCIAPRYLKFWRSVEKSWCHFMSKISQTQPMFFFLQQSFLFWNQISYFKGHVYSSLIVEMKSERYQFWKRSFENPTFWSKTQHTSFKIGNPFIVLYFENRNWPVAR